MLRPDNIPFAILAAVILGYLVRRLVAYNRFSNLTRQIIADELARSRRAMSDRDFAEALSVPPTEANLVVIEEVRRFIADAASMPADKILPQDAFIDGKLDEVLDWPEFKDEHHMLMNIEDRLKVRLPDHELEKIQAPSSGNYKGRVAEFVMDIIRCVEKARQALIALDALLESRVHINNRLPDLTG